MCSAVFTRTHTEYSAVQYSTLQYSTVQYSTVKYSKVQYSTVQYSTVKYSTVQYSTVQYAKSYKIITSVLLINLPKTNSISLTATKMKNIIRMYSTNTTTLLHFNK
jgi:hypothetical protein